MQSARQGMIEFTMHLRHLPNIRASPSADLNQATALGSCHLNGPYTPVHRIIMVLVFSFSFHLYFLSPHHLLSLSEHSYKHAFYLKKKKKKEEPVFKVFSC